MDDAAIAWVPRSRTGSSTDIALNTAVAVGWIEEQCAHRNTQALVVTNYAQEAWSNQILAEFTSRHRSTTELGWRGQDALGPTMARPILAYTPAGDTLDFASDLAERHSVPLCVVEGKFRVGFWAAMSHAINLSGPIDSSVGDLVEMLVQTYNSSNGSRDAVKPVLKSLRSRIEDPHILRLLAARGMAQPGLKLVKSMIKELIADYDSNHDWLSP